MRFLMYLFLVLTALYAEALVFSSEEAATIFSVPSLTVMIFLLWGLFWSSVAILCCHLLEKFVKLKSVWWGTTAVVIILLAPQLLNGLTSLTRALLVLPVTTALALKQTILNVALAVVYFLILYQYHSVRHALRKRALIPMILLFHLVLGLWIIRIPASQSLKVAGEAKARGSSERLPNIFLFVMDTMRRDAVGLYAEQDIQQSTLSRIAAEGIVFEDAWSPVPYTSGSHASMLFGVYPPHHQVGLKLAELPEDFQSLPRSLRARGYVTGAVSANPHISKYYNYDKHFEFVEEPEKDLGIFPATRRRVMFNKKLVWLMYRLTGQLGVRQQLSRYFSIGQGKIDAASVVDMARRFAEHNRDHPLFLLGNFMETHWPYTSTPEGRTALFHNSGTTWDDLSRKWSGIVRAQLGGGKGVDPFNDMDRRLLQSLYTQEAEYLDEQIGFLLDSLEEMGALDHAFVFVVSDHGELFGEDGYYGHACNLSERLLHVPMIMWWSGGLFDESKRGTRFWPRISLVDLPHTIMEIVYDDQPPPVSREDSMLFTGCSFLQDLSAPPFTVDGPAPMNAGGIAPPGVSFPRPWSERSENANSRDSIPVFCSLGNSLKVLYKNRMAYFEDGEFLEGFLSARDGWVRDTLRPPDDIIERARTYTDVSRGAEKREEVTDKPEFLKEHLRALGYIE